MMVKVMIKVWYFTHYADKVLELPQTLDSTFSFMKGFECAKKSTSFQSCLMVYENAGASTLGF